MTRLLSLLLLFLCTAIATAFRVMAVSTDTPIITPQAMTMTRQQQGPQRSTKVSSPDTRLRASLQFKNVEQMMENFGEEPVLIVFTATNCGPCKLQRKELVSVQKDLPWSIVAIDTDRWPNVGSRFHVGKLPCLVAMKHGEVLLRLEGLRTADEIISNIRSLF